MESEKKEKEIIDKMKMEFEKREKKIFEMKMESELKMKVVIKENKIIDKRVKYLEKKLNEIKENNEKEHNFLLEKYRQALDINLNFIFELRDIKTTFKSYEKKNIDIEEKNSNLKII